jgi:hypothetical protein
MFFATRIENLKEDERHFQLTPDEFSLINPNTMTCPVFRSKQDAELTKKIYRKVPVFIREETSGFQEHNPWAVDLMLMFMMNTASHLFETHDDLRAQGAYLDGNCLHQGDSRYLPLYEAKMVHHYDHRFATYDTEGEDIRDATPGEKADPAFAPLPRYWVNEWEVLLRTADMPQDVIKGLKKQDAEKLDKALRTWLTGLLLVRGDTDHASQLFGRQVIKQGSTGSLFDQAEETKAGLEARELAEAHPILDEQFDEWLGRFESGEDRFALVASLLPDRCPKYLLGFRDICRSTDERTTINSLLPLSAVGNNLPLCILPVTTGARLTAALQANLTSLVFDFVARHKVGGTHMNFFIIKQLPVLPPDAYDEEALDYIFPRVLELTYTSHDLAPFARDLGYEGSPFGWDSERRHQLRCELDAYYAHLYGLTRDELRYILDPADVMGPDYPSVTFPGLKRKEIAEFGEYRTQRRVLEAFDALAATKERVLA